jgi:transposase
MIGYQHIFDLLPAHQLQHGFWYHSKPLACGFHFLKHHAQESSVSRRMAPKLAQSQHSLISDMLRSKSFKTHEIAGVAGCSARSVYAIKSNIRQYGSTKAPSNVGGRPRSITPAMFDALCERLLEKPDLCHDEMVLFFLDEFSTRVTTSSIGRSLRSHSVVPEVILGTQD